MWDSIAKRWKNHMASGALMAFLWMALQAEWSISSALLGLFFGFCISAMAQKLAPLNVKVRKISKVGRLFLAVLKDMIQSNIDVCKAIWRKNPELLQPGFVEIPLTLRNSHALSMLACIITYTPGTVWVELSEDYVLTIHVLDLVNAESWRTLIKNRYETPLKEIFE